MTIDTKLAFDIYSDSNEITIDNYTKDIDGVRKELYKQYIDLKDERIREELIRLGWTPPELQKTCNSCRHFQNEINNEEITCNYHCGFFPKKYKYCGHWEGKDERS